MDLILLCDEAMVAAVMMTIHAESSFVIAIYYALYLCALPFFSN